MKPNNKFCLSKRFLLLFFLIFIIVIVVILSYSSSSSSLFSFLPRASTRKQVVVPYCYIGTSAPASNLSLPACVRCDPSNPQCQPGETCSAQQVIYSSSGNTPTLNVCYSQGQSQPALTSTQTPISTVNPTPGISTPSSGKLLSVCETDNDCQTSIYCKSTLRDGTTGEIVGETGKGLCLYPDFRTLILFVPKDYKTVDFAEPSNYWNPVLSYEFIDGRMQKTTNIYSQVVFKNNYKIYISHHINNATSVNFLHTCDYKNSDSYSKNYLPLPREYKVITDSNNQQVKYKPDYFEINCNENEGVHTFAVKIKYKQNNLQEKTYEQKQDYYVIKKEDLSYSNNKLLTYCVAPKYSFSTSDHDPVISGINLIKPGQCVHTDDYYYNNLDFNDIDRFMMRDLEGFFFLRNIAHGNYIKCSAENEVNNSELLRSYSYLTAISNYYNPRPGHTDSYSQIVFNSNYSDKIRKECADFVGQPASYSCTYNYAIPSSSNTKITLFENECINIAEKLFICRQPRQGTNFRLEEIKNQIENYPICRTPDEYISLYNGNRVCSMNLDIVTCTAAQRLGFGCYWDSSAEGNKGKCYP